ncbi:MAG TPA: hypothetical protein VH419_07890 [Nocardioidaceae bacterium]
MLAAVRRIGVLPSHVEGPRFTLVNLETTFFTTPHPVSRSLTLIGFDVDVRVTPTSYSWHWGDGTSQQTSSPGRPFPARDVTHVYRQHTDNGAPLALRVDTVYTARYRVDGGPWQQIPEALTIPGPATALPVKQASAVLVAGD